MQRDAEVAIDDARRAAFELLASVRRDDVYANLQWPAVLERYRLAGRDAAFATDLAYGTLRWLGFYDLVAAEVSSRSWSDVDPDIVDIVRLGVHQLLSMRVPTMRPSIPRASSPARLASPMRVGSDSSMDSCERWRDAIARSGTRSLGEENRQMSSPLPLPPTLYG